MGKKNSQDQSAPTHISDYEKSKLLRVQENQERLRQLGIKNMANSLTSLVDSQKPKKTKNNPTTTSERDAKRVPEEVSGRSLRAAKTQHRPQFIAPLSMNKYANLAKKRIVAPNDSRTIPVEEGCEGQQTFPDSNASKKSRLQQCDEANEQNLEFVDTSATKKNQPRSKLTVGELLLKTKGSQMQRAVLKKNKTKPNCATTTISSGPTRQLFDEHTDDEDVLRSQDFNGRDIDEVGKKQSRANVTMGELLLNKKPSQMQQGVLKKNTTKTNSAPTTISSGSTRQLFDEHTDDEEVLRSQDFNERDIDEVGKHQSRTNVTMGELLLNKKGSQMQRAVLKKNAKKPNSATTSILSGSRSQTADEDIEDEDDLIYQPVNVAYREDGGYEDDENEDMEDDVRLDDEESVEDDENENIEANEEYDGCEDEFENEDAELEILQIDGSQKGTGISTTKKRGPTMMHNIHTREFERREVIICNEFKQPIGPSTKENDVVGKFSRFLGTIARTYSYCPLTCSTWHKVPDKDRMWEYVLEKYIVPVEAKSYVLQSIGALWRGHKSRLKKKHFYDLKDNSTRLKQRPKSIPEKDFMQLLRLWNTKEDQKRCLIAKKRRMSQKNLHTAGPKSFARIREDLKNEDPNKEPPSLTKMFERTRERKQGHLYADTYDDTENLIEQMKNYSAPEEDESGEGGSSSVDAFVAVMNKEYNGHRRLFGRGVTNKLIKKVSGSETSYMVPGELMESVRTNIDTEVNRLVEMRKQIEDDHEQKKLEIAEEHKRNKAELEDMRKDIEDQRDKFVEDAFAMLIQKLPARIVKEFLT